MRLQTIKLPVGEAADLLAARDWYRDRFGLTLVHEEADESAWFETEGVQLGLHVGPKVYPPELVELYFEVEDVEGTYERLTRQGVTFTLGPAHQPWGATVARTADPAGHSVHIMTYD